MRLATLLLVAALVGLPTAAWAAGDEEPALPAYVGGAASHTVKATAYTSGPESTGKRPGHPQYGLTFSGTRAKEGRTIAVDPRRIPLGSRVCIAELKGCRIAEDVGGAIQGDRIDLYMEEVADALKWGVRQVRVEVFPQI